MYVVHVYVFVFVHVNVAHCPTRRLRGVRGPAKLTRFDEPPVGSNVQSSVQVDGMSLSTGTTHSRWELLSQQRAVAVEAIEKFHRIVCVYTCECYMEIIQCVYVHVIYMYI